MSSEERIDQIRDAALALFAERGYLATTMADIGSAVGIRGPSIYKHVPSKQHLPAEIMTATMRDLQTGFDQATASTDDVVDRFRRAVDAHVRFHARRRLEAFVGTREIRNLEPEPHDQVVAQRTRYENGFRELIEEGAAAGVFHTRSPKLASYAVLDMGMGISVWYREDGDLAEDALAYAYDDHALRLVGYRQAAGD